MKRYQYWLPCHYRDDSQIFLRGATTRMVPIMAEVVASPCFFFLLASNSVTGSSVRIFGSNVLVILRSFVKKTKVLFSIAG